MRHALPPLDSLWAFHIIAETGSLTAAAAVLHVTQPAVSKRLRDLEAALGCALVRRGANAISLTALGSRFAAEVSEGFAQLQTATENLQVQNPPLRIRAFTTWALRWLIPRLPAFRALQPGIEVEVSTSTAAVDLAREGVDAAISTAPVDRPPFPAAIPLQPVVIAPFAAPAVAASWRDGCLEQRPLGSKVRAGDWQKWQEARGWTLRAPPLLFESTTLAIQAALEGLGIVICPPAFLRDEVRSGRLVPLGGQPLATGDCYWLILPQGRVSTALRIFSSWLVGEATSERLAPEDEPSAG
jgi:LysR family glycine cleavage system transcriptional activator